MNFYGDTIAPMFRSKWFKVLLGLVFVLLLAILVYQIPAVNSRLGWRLDALLTYFRVAMNPIEESPPALTPMMPMATETPQATPSFTPTDPGATATTSPTATSIPDDITLETPRWEKQDWNNCGPATLSMNLRYYGWGGDQFDISELLKPERADRNVNVEELAFFVRTRAGWLNVQYRVGGSIELLKEFLAAGIPVIVEKGYQEEITYWPNDDRWAGHYLLLTGYDDTSQSFIAQDSFIGADQIVEYQRVDDYWKTFNRVFMLIYPPTMEGIVKEILGMHWDVDFNREDALALSEVETENNPQDAYAWFNLGTNLVYFERYTQAAQAYDTARTLGLPQRMFRYQFGPFLAYFHSGRTEELIALSEYALRVTRNSEEALLWHGWGMYRQGDLASAVEDFRAAYEANPYYQDTLYALDFLGVSP